MIQKEKIYNLIVTEKCNLNCHYCYAYKGNGVQMDKRTAVQVCNFVKKDIYRNKISSAQIIFGGNEPLLNFKIVKFIINNLIKQGGSFNFNFIILTNLWAMNQSILKWVKQRKVIIHTTLDGPRDLHDLNRGKGSFTKTIFWIRQIHQDNIPLLVSSVVSRASLKNYKRIIDFFLKEGIEHFNFRPLMLIGAAKINWSRFGYTSIQFLSFRKNIINYIEKLNLKNEFLLKDDRFLYFIHKIVGDKEKTYLISPPCNGIKKQLCIDPLGNIYVCDEGRSQPDIFMIGDLENGVNQFRARNFFSLLNKKYQGKCEKENCEFKDICGPCLAVENYPLARHFRCSILKNEFSFCYRKIKNKI